MNDSNKSTLHGYAIAFTATLGALLVRAALDPLLGEHLPYVTFFVAVAVTTFYAGLGASVTAVMLGGLAAAWAFVPPRGIAAMAGVSDYVGLALYFLVACVILGFGQALRRAKHQAEAARDGLRLEMAERNRTKDALLQSEERFRMLADHMSQLAWMGDASGSLTWYNRRWYEYTGTTFEQMQGWGWQQVHHPDHIDRVVEKWKRAHINGDVWEDTFPLRGTDGQYRWFLSRAIPIRNAEGHVVRWFGTNTDVTALREAQEALRRSEEQLRLITDIAPVYIASCDTEGRYRFVNRGYAERFGVRPEDCVGNTMEDIVGRQAFAIFRTHVDEALKGNRVEFEVDVPYGDQGTQWLHSSYVPEFRPDGRVNGLVAVLTDMTIRKQAEQALLESQERLQAFAGQLEHLVDQRTEELVHSQRQLRALATELNLTEQRERKRVAVELHDHLAQLLVLSKLKLSQIKNIRVFPSEYHGLITETDAVLTQCLAYTRTLVAELSPPVLRDFGLPMALKWLADQMRQHELRVAVTLSQEDLQVPEEQAVLLFQSVRELLMNVVKHAEYGDAAVTLEQTNGELRIQVRDDGRGFDLSAASHDPASTLSSRFGLFSIRERMRAMGGRFEIESGQGKGTTATLVLPLHNDTAGAGTPVNGIHRAGAVSVSIHGLSGAAASVTAHDPGPVIRVLLVDDHAMVREGLRTVLDSYADIEVVGEASDGVEAIAAAEHLRPGIVVMDINMPRKNGVEATAEIRARHPEISVIGLSVNAGVESQRAMTAAGASMLITKEAAVDELYSSIRNVIR